MKPPFMKPMTKEEDEVWYQLQKVGFNIEICVKLLKLYCKSSEVISGVTDLLYMGWQPYMCYSEAYLRRYPWIWASGFPSGVSVCKGKLIMQISNIPESSK